MPTAYVKLYKHKNTYNLLPTQQHWGLRYHTRGKHTEVTFKTTISLFNIHNTPLTLEFLPTKEVSKRNQRGTKED